MTSSEVKRLRAEARRVQRNAGAKISRLEKQDIFIRSTEFDPRIDLKRVDRYNATQLKSYIRKLNNFNNRTNKFRASLNGQPVPQKLWDSYLNEQERFNKYVDSRTGRYEGVQLPGTSTTVLERVREDLPDTRKRRKMNDGHNRPIHHYSRDSTKHINGAKAVKLMIEELKTKRTKKFSQQMITAQKFQAAEMFDKLGLDSVKQRMFKMSSQQFDLLWNYTDFANRLSNSYEVMKAKSDIKSTAIEGEEFNNYSNSMIDWANGSANAKKKETAKKKRSRR